MADQVFNYMDAQGRPKTAASSAVVPGTPGYVSSKLSPDGTSTADGDVFNAFRGYVGPQGGSFGAAKGRQGFETVSGVSGDKLGLGPDATDDQYDTFTRQFGGIANRDQGSIDAALKSDNPFLRRTAAAYQLGRGSEGLSDDEFAKYEAGGADALAPPPVDFSRAYAQSAAEEAAGPGPQVPTDPFGRFDAPTAANNVIKPGQDRFAPQGAPVQAPQDPFAPFQPNMTPQGTPGLPAGVQATPAAIQPATFGAPQEGASFAPGGIQPINISGNIPLPDLGGGRPPQGGPQFTPQGGPPAAAPLLPAQRGFQFSPTAAGPSGARRAGMGGMFGRGAPRQPRLRPIGKGVPQAAQPTPLV